MDKKMEKVKCNLCETDSSSLLFKAEDFFTKSKFSLVKCNNCGLVFINPRPSQEEISAFYPEKEYFLESKRCVYSFDDTLKDNSKRSSLNNFRINAQKIVVEDSFGNKEKSNYKRNLSAKLISYLSKHRMGRFKLDIKKGKILDVGCGDGSFLVVLKELGWQTSGTEISKVVCDKAKEKGLNVICKDLLEVDFKENSFDVVRMWSVLEHLHNPSVYLKEIKRILKPGGILLIQVPNFNSFASFIFRSNWSGLDAPRHLYHFNRKTLGKIVKKEGFRINNIHTISVGTVAASLNLDRIYPIRFLLFIFDIIFNYLRIGDSIVCYAKKR